MRKALTVVALAALLVAGAGLGGCASKKECCGTEPGKCCKDPGGCPDCKAAGGPCEKCRAAEPAK